MPPANPTVSVVVPTYCRPAYLERAVDSVLAQTYDPVELVVVDDNPETPAREALANLPLETLSNVELVTGGDHENAAAARNTGVEVASGDLIAFLDDDDWWQEEKLARQVERFATGTDDLGLVTAGAEMVLPGGDREVSLPPAFDGDTTKTLLCENVVGSMSVVLVRASLARDIPFDERFPSWEDLVWYVDLSRHCSFARIPDPLTVYDHRSPDRLSDDPASGRESRRLFVAKYDDLAADYGSSFRQRMRGFAAFRAGHCAFHCGEYRTARSEFLTALSQYPLERRFYTYLLAALGGRSSHRAARVVKSLASRIQLASPDSTSR